MKRTLTGVLLPFICYCTALANVVVSGKVVSTTGETLPALVTARVRMAGSSVVATTKTPVPVVLVMEMATTQMAAVVVLSEG